MKEIHEWRHLFKLDPNKENDDTLLEAVCMSGTDAIMVGGTDGVTLDLTLDLLSRLRRYAVPCVLEVSNLESITPGFDGYFIPSVLNSKKREWIVGLHHEAIGAYGDYIPWDDLVAEGYCILNPECKAALRTEALIPKTIEEVISYAQLADQLFRLPVVYLEYSGTYGDPELVKRVTEKVEHATVFYGGGIETAAQAREMAARSHVIVVGNALYTNAKSALATVKAAREVAKPV